jgi:hypothetical protein
MPQLATESINSTHPCSLSRRAVATTWISAATPRRGQQPTGVSALDWTCIKSGRSAGPLYSQHLQCTYIINRLHGGLARMPRDNPAAGSV